MTSSTLPGYECPFIEPGDAAVSVRMPSANSARRALSKKKRCHRSGRGHLWGRLLQRRSGATVWAVSAPPIRIATVMDSAMRVDFMIIGTAICFSVAPRAIHFAFFTSPAKMVFQSFFMLITVQPLALAVSIKAWENVPTLVSGRPPVGP